MPGQRTTGKVRGVGAGLEPLVVPAVGKRPIPLELVAAGVSGKRPFDFRPRHVPMPFDVPIGDGVGNPLVAKLPDQPIEDHRSVMVGDCTDEARSDCGTLKVIDPCTLTGNPADLANKGLGVVHSLTRTTCGQPGFHVRSTPLIGAGRQCRRRCTAALFESTGARRESERPAMTRQPCGRAVQPG